MNARVVSVNCSSEHSFSKPAVPSVRLIAGLGVEGDAHLGETVKHRSRVRVDPTKPNLRQVHLIHAELLDELAAKGFVIEAGALGENITTRGVDLLELPTGTLLKIGASAVIEVTGLRNPCHQIESFRAGLLAQVVDKAKDGAIVRKSGIMAVVRSGGEIRPWDAIVMELPPKPWTRLEVV